MNDLAEKHAAGATRCTFCDEVTACRVVPNSDHEDEHCCLHCYGPPPELPHGKYGKAWEDFPLAPAEQAVIDRIRLALKEQARRYARIAEDHIPTSGRPLQSRATAMAIAAAIREDGEAL